MLYDVNWGVILILRVLPCLPGITHVYDPVWTLKSNLNTFPRKWEPLKWNALPSMESGSQII